MEKPIVKVVNLSHKYATQWAIKDINFEINEHGVMGLLGSNGAGKSTTMNIICGVLNQTEGDVYINGIDLRKDPVEAKKFLGFLPQRPPLYADLTVDEYLTYTAKLRLMNPMDIPHAVEVAKDKCGISHFSKRLAKNLSGGYQQRLGIAQSIIHNPKFVILDEPTNGLDPNQILEVRKLIKEIAENRSILVSTHILSEVKAICDHIKMIELGHMVFEGTMDEFNNYIQPNSFVVRFAEETKPEEAIGAIEGITKVIDLGENRYRAMFHRGHAGNLTEKVVALSGEKGWRLSEIALEKVSLDEIFAQLSGKAHIKEEENEEEEA